MQAVCLLFSGRRGLNDQETRHSILRIPEVSRQLQTAQTILDCNLKREQQVDLYSFVLANNDEFNLHQNLKCLVSNIVQVGLFDRYVKFRNRPTFLAGCTNGSSALKVCAGKQSFEDFVFQSDYFKEAQGLSQIPVHDTQLMGFSLEEYGLFQWNQNGEYIDVETETKDAARIVGSLSAENQINQCIHIGPTSSFRNKEFESLGSHPIASMCSIDLDPILSSFWKTA